MTDFADENNNKSSGTSHIKSLEDNERKDESETTLEHQKRNDEAADNKPDDNASSVSASKKNIGMHCEGNDKTNDGHNIELKNEFTNNDQESSSISVASDDKRDESQDQSDTKEENTGLDGATDVKKNSDQAHNAREKDKDAEKPNASVEKENKSSEKATGIEAPTTNNNINPAEKAEKIKVHFVAVGSAVSFNKVNIYVSS